MCQRRAVARFDFTQRSVDVHRPWDRTVGNPAHLRVFSAAKTWKGDRSDARRERSPPDDPRWIDRCRNYIAPDAELVIFVKEAKKLTIIQHLVRIEHSLVLASLKI